VLREVLLKLYRDLVLRQVRVHARRNQSAILSNEIRN